MKNRLYIAAALLAVMIAGVYSAFVSSRPVLYGLPVSESYTYLLLFRPGAWLIPLSALLGMFLRASFKNVKDEPVFANGKILRHDTHMFFWHWSHVLSVLILLTSGLVKGPLFLPRLVHTPEAAGFMLNLHFIGIIIFAFGLFYYISGLIIEGGLSELLPNTNDFKAALFYYTSKIGIGKEPGQDKFLANEKLAYPIWIILVGGLTITGGIKVAAHIWLLPSGLMGVMTLIHDICALGILILLVTHVFLGAVVPWSWPLLGSMVSGYMSEEYVKEKHALWYDELRKGKKV